MYYAEACPHLELTPGFCQAKNDSFYKKASLIEGCPDGYGFMQALRFLNNRRRHTHLLLKTP